MSDQFQPTISDGRLHQLGYDPSKLSAQERDALAVLDEQNRQRLEADGFIPPRDQQQQHQPVQPVPQGRSHRTRNVVLGIVGGLVGISLLGAALGGDEPAPVASGSQTSSAASTPSPSTSSSTPSPSPSTSTTTEAEPEEEVEPEPVVVPVQAKDFRITLKIREKQCFGSAGCLITYQIKPKYEGAGDIEHGSYSVTYKVTGGEDGPQINTFSVEDGSASYDEEETISTSSRSSKLHVKVTSVDDDDL